MHGDYIEVVTPESSATMRQAFLTAARPLSVHICSEGSVLLGLDEHCFAYLDLSPGDEWSARLAVGHLADHHYTRGLIAHRIYQTLIADTTWRIRWTSDASPTGREIDGTRQLSRQRRLHRQRLNARAAQSGRA